MSQSKVSIRNLHKRYQGRNRSDITVLKEINLDIRAEEFICIVGPSGCGKTTFIKIIDGLVRATSGQVYINGVEVSEPGYDRAFVFQADSLYPWRTVLDNICFGLEIKGIERSQRYPKARELIRMVGLGGFESHYPHELSGGMRQRVNLARALAVDPEIILMDEPFAALDAQTREVMQQELLKIWYRSKKTAIFITHQIDEAVYLADRVVVFSARPATIKADIRVDITRPRSLAVKRTPQFLAYVGEIWNLIEADVLESMTHSE
ncbi:ABC transporter ATP-binding protein [bacterium]|nr:MAG: ABC transporter ATP-binding protein [bacterium]